MRTRRDFIWQTGGGFAGVALLDLLARDGYWDRVVSANSILSPKAPHFPAKAKRAALLKPGSPEPNAASTLTMCWGSPLARKAPHCRWSEDSERTGVAGTKAFV